MNGSILIIGNNFIEGQQRVLSLLASWKLPNSPNNPDLLVIEPFEDKKSIGISQIKEILGFLNKKPFQSECKAVVIQKAGLLTTDAQNALLKVLEEPPAYANLILFVEKEGDVLPTILSRCQKIFMTNVGVGEGQGSDFKILDILNMSTGEKLAKAEELGKMDRDEVVTTLKNWVMDLRKENTAYATHIKNIMTVISDLENTNVSLKLAVEFLLLKL